MTLYHALVLLPMFALLTWAAIHDVRTRRIPNLLNLRKPHGKPWKYDHGRPGEGHRNQSARPWEK